MVEFCPKCGSLLFPTREKSGKIVLVCHKCKYKKEKSSSSYRVVQKISADKKIKTLVIEKPRKIDRERKERERELLQEYYEIFLETMAAQEAEETEE